jgi:hypothetical protein
VPSANRTPFYRLEHDGQSYSHAAQQIARTMEEARLEFTDTGDGVAVDARAIGKFRHGPAKHGVARISDRAGAVGVEGHGASFVLRG